jgi:hypothetical protein
LVANFDVAWPRSPVFAADVLFVIDDSPSMAEEQAHLRNELPRMFDMLRTGRSQNPAYLDSAFPALGDLHVSVVSADLGLDAAAPVPGCSSTGDDGVFHRDASCLPNEPSFISYYEQRDDPLDARNALTCNAALGASGCAVTQPLEATLKALLPFDSAGPSLLPETTLLLGADFRGHGALQDRDFLRDTQPDQGADVLIVFVTDKDDCSISDKLAFGAAALSSTNLAQTCSAREDTLFPIQRYVDAIQRLPAEVKNHLNVAIVAGVPRDLVNDEARSTFDIYNASQRDAYYQKILDDPRMQPQAVVAAGSITGIEPSCTSANASATPPRRLVELARSLPPGTVSVRSICADDLTLALSDLRSLHWYDYALPCLPTPLARDRDGLVSCRVTWELPPAVNSQAPLTPTACSERPDFLTDAGSDFPHTRSGSGALCEVTQISKETALAGAPHAEGFYYDMNSRNCGTRGDIGFSSAAAPPTGVLVRVHCIDDVQREPTPAPSFEHPPVTPVSSEPQIGTPCDPQAVDANGRMLSGDEVCAGDNAPAVSRLFCHPQIRLCQRACSTDLDCPTRWRCDPGDAPLAMGAGRSLCVNPSCAPAEP